MKEKSMKGRTLAIAATLFLIVLGIALYVIYFLTKYPLYYFVSMTAVLLGVTNLFPLLLKAEERRQTKCKERIERMEYTESAEDTECAEDKEKKRHARHRKHRKRTKRLCMRLHMPILVVICIVSLFVFLGCVQGLITYISAVHESVVLPVIHGVLLAVLAVIALVLQKLCKYVETESRFVSALLSNMELFLMLILFETVTAAGVIVFESLQIFYIQRYVGYVYAACVFYYAVFLLLSLMIVAVRKEFYIDPFINILLPSLPRFGKGEVKRENGRESFFDYLERNTGISMRGLWSFKYVKQIAPTALFLSALFLWLSTSIIQVEPSEQAAVYRIGDLQENLLKPGIHLVFPYPIDRVIVYDTEAVNRTTIGYKSEEAADNLWTAGHGDGGEEYKLLLGSGDEVVSINLRLEYKISDLKQYLKCASMPESILEALAYEQVTDETIGTDLATLLSIDRDAFAEKFREKLSEKLKERQIGLDVVSVVLESIHPPIEIASVYQEIISSEIMAERNILSAQGAAAVKIAAAEDQNNQAVSDAKVAQTEKVAKAKAVVTEFLASKEADQKYGENYRYQKYLNAVREAYGKANLVIVGEGVDKSALYFGSIPGSTSKGSEDSTDKNTGGTDSESSTGSTDKNEE